MERSISCGFSPSPTDSEPCGSKSTRSTLRPYSASDAPRLIVVVVLPTPPFWLHIDTTRAWPWRVAGGGPGETGGGRRGGAGGGRASAGRWDRVGGRRWPVARTAVGRTRGAHLEDRGKGPG